MQHALLLPRQVGNMPQFVGMALEHDHLGTHVLIEVHVGRGQHEFVMMVLQVRQLLVQFIGVVVIDQRQRP